MVVATRIVVSIRFMLQLLCNVLYTSLGSLCHAITHAIASVTKVSSKNCFSIVTEVTKSS